MLIQNLSVETVKPVRARYCESFFCRLRGLTFRRNLAVDDGLLLVQSRDSRLDAAIHMLGVWMDLAVIWIDSSKVVVDLRLARRWHPIYIPERPARYILEVAATRLSDFHVGDQLSFI
ncbi:MAG: DUF192 domain-containing protein [Anaerolineales bacterium]